MSVGEGRDSLKFSRGRENQQWKRKMKKLGAEEFAQAIAKIAVAQVCEGVGFQSFQQFALDNLADIGVRYIREIGKTASSYANLANRSQCNVFDVIQGLEELGSVQGFSGASDVNHSLSGSGQVKDLIRYVGKVDEIPFAYLTPAFPVVKERTLNPSFSQQGKNPPDEHIPSWLPVFPDPETYLSSSSGNEKRSETEVVNKIQPVDEHQRKVGMPLVNFQKKLVCNGLEGGVVEQGDASRSQRTEESNPFLATPLQYGEKEVSLPVIPGKFLDDVADCCRSSEDLENNLIMSEPSLRPHETVSDQCEPEDRRKILLDGRPMIQFKFGNGKKSLQSIENLPVWFSDDRDESIEKVPVWFSDDRDENDMKKRRADNIQWEDARFQADVPHL